MTTALDRINYNEKVFENRYINVIIDEFFIYLPGSFEYDWLVKTIYEIALIFQYTFTQNPYNT